MYKIILKGLAGKSNTDDRSTLDGVDCQDEFSEYFHNSFRVGDKIYPNQQCLIDKRVKNGYMRFSYENGKLYVIVEYDSNEELNEDEIDNLIKYTQGQMSDGIGEGFEQCPCKYDGGVEIFVSPWFMGQKLEAKQTKI